MTQHLIIGAGEVGQALYEVLESAVDEAVYLTDSNPTNPFVVHPPIKTLNGQVWEPDVLHIAFPYSDDFAAEVNRYIHLSHPDLVVVHSTVPVGTCANLDDPTVVHSPIRGRHPHLAESIRTFVKHFGGPRADEAAIHFSARGIETSVTPRSATTEAGKLWEMAQFAVNIAMEKEVTRYCEAYGVSRDVVYTEFASAYNEGYAKLDLDQFVRPILEHMPGQIGGHCVMPALEWLSHSDPDMSSWLQDWLANLVGKPIPMGKPLLADGELRSVGVPDDEVGQIIRGWLNAKESAHRLLVMPEPEDGAQSSGPSLEETDPNLISQLKVMGDNWGSLGVARAAALLTDTDRLVKDLAGPESANPNDFRMFDQVNPLRRQGGNQGHSVENPPKIGMEDGFYP